ncbi:MAG: hypothetical protein KIS81_12505 [Maricaulaceae bacterium]|nr:hypothetical protein [Maricaulaceae bacterium]
MTKSRKIRAGLMMLGGVTLAAAWLAVGAAWMFDAPRALFVAAVIAAAVATEAMVWLTALVLGWTAVANRHWLLGRLLGRRGA